MTRLAPAPRPHPLLGHLRLVQSEHLSGVFSDCHRALGDTFSLRFGPPLPGVLRVTVTRSSQAIGTVLSARSPFTKTGHPFFESFREVLGTGLFSAYDDEWRWQRRVLQPLFTAQRSAAYARLMRKRTDEAVALWLGRGEPISLRRELRRLTLVIVTDLLFGSGRDDIADELEEVFHPVTQYVVDRMRRPVPLPRSAPLPSVRRAERQVARVYDLVDAVLARAVDDDDSFVGRLRTATDHDSGRRFTDAEIRDQVLVFIAAGHDTTATAATATLHLLGLHPDEQERAAAEVAAHGPVGEAADAARLPFVTACIDEAMRLYPSAPGTGRLATEDTVVDGFLVPQGTACYANFWGVHHHPDLYADPEAFSPQRFVDVPALERPRHTYLPFGAGPRACIGAHTAVLELQTIVSTVLASARVTPLTRDLQVRSAITLEATGDLPTLMTPR